MGNGSWWAQHQPASWPNQWSAVRPRVHGGIQRGCGGRGGIGGERRHDRIRPHPAALSRLGRPIGPECCGDTDGKRRWVVPEALGKFAGINLVGAIPLKAHLSHFGHHGVK